MADMTWGEPEWWSPADFESGISDYDEAYAASDEEFLTECQVTHVPEERVGSPGWFWMVKATSNLSEWPEVQDAGSCGSREEGQRLAQACVDGIYARRAAQPRSDLELDRRRDAELDDEWDREHGLD